MANWFNRKAITELVFNKWNWRGMTMDYRLAFPSEYLAAFDLQGDDFLVEISKVEMEDLRTIQGGTKKKLVLSFKGAKKRMVCNKTNATAIAKLYGPETKEWVGKTITLFPTQVEAFGEIVEAIRCK
jgi:hypothetical protein